MGVYMPTFTLRSLAIRQIRRTLSTSHWQLLGGPMVGFCRHFFFLHTVWHSIEGARDLISFCLHVYSHCCIFAQVKVWQEEEFVREFRRLWWRRKDLWGICYVFTLSFVDDTSKLFMRVPPCSFFMPTLMQLSNVWNCIKKFMELFVLQVAKDVPEDEKEDEPAEWKSYWKPNITINLVDDFTRYNHLSIFINCLFVCFSWLIDYYF